MLNRRETRRALALVREAMRDAFVGSRFGWLWVIGNPLLMFVLFGFVFGFVLQMKAPGAERSLDYVAWLVSGYAPWLTLTTGITAGANAFVTKRALLLNTDLHPNVLILSMVLPAFSTVVVGVGFLLALRVAGFGHMNGTILLFPFVAALHLVLCYGLSLVLSWLSLGLRDLLIALPNLFLALVFFSPIFYGIDLYPPWLQTLQIVNPFAAIVACFRAVTYHGTQPGLRDVFVVLVHSAVLIAMGWKMSQAARRHLWAEL